MGAKDVSTQLKAFRSRIEAIDRELLKLLAERMQRAQEIGDLKKREGLDVTDPIREGQLEEDWTRWAGELNLPAEFVMKILNEVLDASRKRQEGK